MSFAKQKRRQIKKELSFRSPLAVRETLVFPSGSAFPVCPRCGSTMEREYQMFCDRCGQKLDWSLYDWAGTVTGRYEKRQSP